MPQKIKFLVYDVVKFGHPSVDSNDKQNQNKYPGLICDFCLQKIFIKL